MHNWLKSIFCHCIMHNRDLTLHAVHYYHKVKQTCILYEICISVDFVIEQMLNV